MTEEIKIIVDMLSKVTDGALVGVISYLVYSFLYLIAKLVAVYFIIKLIVSGVKSIFGKSSGLVIDLQTVGESITLGVTDSQQIVRKLKSVSNSKYPYGEISKFMDHMNSYKITED